MKDEMWESIAKLKGYDSMKLMLNELYVKRHQSLEEVGAVVCCSPGTVSKLLLCAGIPTRSKPPRPRVPKKALKEMTTREIEKHYKVSRSTAWRMKLEAGYPPITTGPKKRPALEAEATSDVDAE